MKDDNNQIMDGFPAVITTTPEQAFLKNLQPEAELSPAKTTEQQNRTDTKQIRKRTPAKPVEFKLVRVRKPTKFKLVPIPNSAQFNLVRIRKSSGFKLVRLRKCPFNGSNPGWRTSKLAVEYYRQNILTSPTFNPNIESLVVLLLDKREWIKGHIIVSTGDAVSAPVPTKDIFRLAYIGSAAHLILMHNHPGGDARPSNADIKITRALIWEGMDLGIDIYDHIVIATSGSDLARAHYSFREQTYPGRLLEAVYGIEINSPQTDPWKPQDEWATRNRSKQIQQPPSRKCCELEKCRQAGQLELLSTACEHVNDAMFLRGLGLIGDGTIRDLTRRSREPAGDGDGPPPF